MSGTSTALSIARRAGQIWKGVRSTRQGRNNNEDDDGKTPLWAKLLLLILIAIPFAAPIAIVIVLVVLISSTTNTSSPYSACNSSTSVISADNPSAAAGDLPARSDYTEEQLRNASVILQVGQERGIPSKAQAIAVMTALGESGMRNLDYGDARFGVRNPDGTLTSSIGMFQEQKWYGTVEERLDPVLSSGRYYDRLLAVTGWETLEPTIAAHKAQRNADPYHYAKYWEEALNIIKLVGGQEFAACEVSQAVVMGGWANPAVGRKASGFGPRSTGIAGASSYHLGQDIAAACGTPVYAAASGRVVISGATGWGTGNTIRIEHANGLDSTYGHLLTGTNLVQVGDRIEAGQQIADMGGDSRIDPAGAGTSSGCHLHFELRRNSAAFDPEPFMSLHGITLGAQA